MNVLLSELTYFRNFRLIASLAEVTSRRIGHRQHGVPSGPIAVPPDDATRYELARDATLAFLSRKEFTAFAVLLIPFVLGFGGLWFFLLIGLHTLEEEQAHFWQNVAIQILTVCMAYAAAVSLPYRAANAHHLCCSHRSSTVGLDFYGRPTQDIWFHLPRGHRGAITVLLLGNCGAQFVNRGARCVYPSYESSHRMPGFFWTTGFLLFAFLLQGVAAAYTAVLQSGLRKAHPGRFAPSPLERLRLKAGELCIGRTLTRRSGAPLRPPSPSPPSPVANKAMV